MERGCWELRLELWGIKEPEGHNQTFPEFSWIKWCRLCTRSTHYLVWLASLWWMDWIIKRNSFRWGSLPPIILMIANVFIEIYKRFYLDSNEFSFIDKYLLSLTGLVSLHCLQSLLSSLLQVCLAGGATLIVTGATTGVSTAISHLLKTQELLELL